MGLDRKEQVAYDVAKSSILRRTSKPEDTAIFPLALEHLKMLGLLTRPIEIKDDGTMWCPISKETMKTEYDVSRFIVRALAQRGWALYVDSDIVCLSDITELFALSDDKYAVMVVDNPKRERASVVLWNLDHRGHKDLTWDALNNWTIADLYVFKWLKAEQIGELPGKWNYLVGASTEPAVTSGIYNYVASGSSGQLRDVWLKEKELSGL